METTFSFGVLGFIVNGDENENYYGILEISRDNGNCFFGPGRIQTMFSTSQSLEHSGRQEATGVPCRAFIEVALRKPQLTSFCEPICHTVRPQHGIKDNSNKLIPMNLIMIPRPKNHRPTQKSCSRLLVHHCNCRLWGGGGLIQRNHWHCVLAEWDCRPTACKEIFTLCLNTLRSTVITAKFMYKPDI